jgi:rhodanese-related sulfurtransferase
MKKKLSAVLALLAVVGLAAAAAQSRDPVGDAVAKYFADWPGNRIIAEKDLVAKVEAGEPMVLVDIRSAADYAKGHLKGAVNMAWGTSALTDGLKYLPHEGQVYVYCYTGQTAGQTVALLNVAGVPAQSVRLGWNLGISKVPGVDKVTTTAATPVGTAKTYAVDPEIDAAYRAYFSDMAGKAGTAFANNIISEAEAKKRLDSGDKGVVFVSVRQAADFAQGHIRTATNIPWGKGMNVMFSNLPARKTIIVYCYSGQTAGQTVAALRLLGYDAVSLRGGMGNASNAPQGWANQGYPVVK